jgi:hypothetical protein
MPRGPRLDAPGSLHHVIARGLERRRFFVDDRLTGGDPYQKYHRPYCGYSPYTDRTGETGNWSWDGPLPQ